MSDEKSGTNELSIDADFKRNPNLSRSSIVSCASTEWKKEWETSVLCLVFLNLFIYLFITLPQPNFFSIFSRFVRDLGIVLDKKKVIWK